MSNKRLLVLPLLVVSACGSEAPREDLARSDRAALFAASCSETSEFPHQPDPKAETRARERLAVIAPDATLSWSAPRATLADLAGAALDVSGCKDPDADLHQEILSTLASEPDLFQLDPGEWSASSGACRNAEDRMILSFQRVRMAGLEAKRDSLAVILDVSEDGREIRIERVLAHYLPQKISGLEEFAADCPTLSGDEATKIAYAERYAYDTFESCVLTGSGSYSPNAPDAVAVSETSLTWSEESGGVIIQARARGTLTVDPQNHTPELLQSNAHCPWGTVAWNVTFDPVKGLVVESSPGVDCIVC